MDHNLQQLIELARNHKITPEEHEAQVRSFTLRQPSFGECTITREDVDKAVTLLKGADLPWEVTR